MIGKLTDKGMVDGKLFARIDDQPYEVLAFVEKYLDRLKKGDTVEYTVSEGKIRNIAKAPQAGGKVIDIAGEAIEEAKKRIAAGFDNPPEPEATVPAVQQAQIEIPPAVVVAHPAPAIKSYTDDEMMLLRNVIAKGCTEPEFKLLMYMARTYGLDPLLKQIWAVKRNDRTPALIFAGRDGMLAIAHRSGQFDGMQSGVVYEKKTIDAGKPTERIIDVPVSAWCEVWRKDMSHSFKTEVPFSEYNTGFGVWETNPSAMILKVGESVCLRKAFSVSGLYCPEEINTGVK